MKNVVFTLSALILLSASEASSVDTEFGIWTDKTNQVAYGFLSNHEFIYMAQSDKGIWTKWKEHGIQVTKSARTESKNSVLETY